MKLSKLPPNHDEPTNADAPIPLPPRAVHAASDLAGGLAGLPSDPPRARRPDSANAGRRRARNRCAGRPPCLWPRSSPGPAISELLGRRAARRSGTIVAFQPERHPADCPALSLHSAVDPGGAAGGDSAFGSGGRALGATAQPLGRSRCSAWSACSVCRSPTSPWARF